MRLKSYKESNYKGPEIIKDFKSNKTNNIRSKGQTKNFNKKRRLSKPYSNNNGLKMAYI